MAARQVWQPSHGSLQAAACGSVLGMLECYRPMKCDIFTSKINTVKFVWIELYCTFNSLSSTCTSAVLISIHSAMQHFNWHSNSYKAPRDTIE